MCVAQRGNIPLFPWSSALSAKLTCLRGSSILGSILDSFIRKWIILWSACAKQPIVHRVRDILHFKYHSYSTLQHRICFLTTHQLASNSSLEQGWGFLFGFFSPSASHNVLFSYRHIKGFSLTLLNLLSQTNDKEVMWLTEKNSLSLI